MRQTLVLACVERCAPSNFVESGPVNSPDEVNISSHDDCPGADLRPSKGQPYSASLPVVSDTTDALWAPGRAAGFILLARSFFDIRLRQKQSDDARRILVVGRLLLTKLRMAPSLQTSKAYGVTSSTWQDTVTGALSPS